MIIYNLTINIDEEVHHEWLNWIKNKHIPDVMATGIFNSFRIFKLLSRQEDETGPTYAIQYACNDLESYDRYLNEFAQSLQEDSQKMFGGRYVAFRTLLEEI